MPMTRIVKLADGEELISYEGVEHAKVFEDDPRRELLEHRRQVTLADGSVRRTSAQRN